MKLVERIAQEFKDVRNHSGLSSFAAYHLLEGNLSVDNFVNTQGMNTTLYTGNGGVQPIVTGVDMATQWGNDASETFGGLVWLKSRSYADNNFFFDTIRGVTNQIISNSTAAQSTIVGTCTSFNSNGFGLGSNSGVNTSSATYASWNFQTTHRRTGVTNHGQTITNHFNPFSGFGIAVFTGSGLTGHEISTLLGRKVALYHIKNISSVTDWFSQHQYDLTSFLKLNLTDAKAAGALADFTDTSIVLNAGTLPINQAGQTYVVYYWANSYFDENKLIGNYEVGVYQGTGASGNKVSTRGKPAWVMVKRLDSTGDWAIFDNLRTPFGTNRLFPSSSSAEVTTTSILTVLSDGFSLSTADTFSNASGGHYLYFGVYDNDNGSGKSKYYKATDNANVQINNAIIPLAKGFDSNGVKNEIVIANETITGVTWEEGKNYPYRTNTGYGKSIHRPRYLKSELVRTYAGEQPDYFDVEKNKWFSCDAGSELVANGDFSSGTTTGWTVGTAVSLSATNETLVVTQTASSNGWAYSSITTTIGKKYKIILTCSGGTSLPLFRLGMSANGTEYANYTMSIEQTYSTEFIAQSTTTYITLYNNSSTTGHTTIWDNISVFQTEITPIAEITESRNYMNHIVHADSQGNPLFVEELPKIKYENIIKADEFRGKNACTAWVNFDGTTTPPTIRDSYNVSKVIRTATGYYDIYFEKAMNTLNFNINFTGKYYGGVGGFYSDSGTRGLNFVRVSVINQAMTAGFNNDSCQVQIFGGKN